MVGLDWPQAGWTVMDIMDHSGLTLTFSLGQCGIVVRPPSIAVRTTLAGRWVEGTSRLGAQTRRAEHIGRLNV